MEIKGNELSSEYIDFWGFSLSHSPLSPPYLHERYIKKCQVAELRGKLVEL